MASSVRPWLAADHCSLGSEPSGPGMPVFMIAVRPRQAFRRSASTSISRPAIFWRTIGSLSTPRSLASSISWPSAIFIVAAAPAPRPARSFISVVMATPQPLPSPPITLASGMRASSMNSSLNSASPVIWCSGLICTASCSMSIRK